MKFECEVIVDTVLPVIRKILTDKLNSEYGLNQGEIARSIGVTQPAVSQYLKGQRADNEVVELLLDDPQISVILDDAVSAAAKGEDFSDDLAQIIQTSRDKGLFKERFEDCGRII